MLDKFLTIIIPYLRGKKVKGELLHRLIKSRLRVGKCQSNRFRQYTDEEIGIIDKLGELNKKGCQRLNAIQEVIPVSDSPHNNESY